MRIAAAARTTLIAATLALPVTLHAEDASVSGGLKEVGRGIEEDSKAGWDAAKDGTKEGWDATKDAAKDGTGTALEKTGAGLDAAGEKIEDAGSDVKD